MRTACTDTLLCTPTEGEHDEFAYFTAAWRLTSTIIPSSLIQRVTLSLSAFCQISHPIHAHARRRYAPNQLRREFNASSGRTRTPGVCHCCDIVDDATTSTGHTQHPDPLDTIARLHGARLYTRINTCQSQRYFNTRTRVGEI